MANGKPGEKAQKLQEKSDKTLTEIKKLQQRISDSSKGNLSGLKKLAELSKPIPLLGDIVGFFSDSVDRTKEVVSAVKDVSSFMLGDKRLDAINETLDVGAQNTLIEEMKSFVSDELEEQTNNDIKKNKAFEELFKDLTREQQFDVAMDKSKIDEMIQILVNSDKTSKELKALAIDTLGLDK